MVCSLLAAFLYVSSSHRTQQPRVDCMNGVHPTAQASAGVRIHRGHHKACLHPTLPSLRLHTPHQRNPTSPSQHHHHQLGCKPTKHSRPAPKIYTPIPPSPRCSSPKISCCSTMEYTLALSSVNTVVVFRSSPLSASKISADGFEASSASKLDNYDGSQSERVL